MKYWEFLIQKEGDQTWLPLETQQVEILEGRYRVVAHTDRVNTPLEIRVSQLITSEMPPRKRLRKRTGKTNETGLVVVMPYVHLKPGQWSLECSSLNVMDDLMGEGWQYGVELDVFAPTEEDWSSEWPVPTDSETVASVIIDNDRPGKAVSTSDAALINQDLPLVQAKAELEQQLKNKGYVPKAPQPNELSSESAAVSTNGTLSNGDAHTDASLPTYKVALRQQAYLAQHNKPMTIMGKVNTLLEGLHTDIFGKASQLWIRLQNPENTQVIMEAHRPLSLARLPADFKVQIQLPAEVTTRVILGEVSLRTAAIDANTPAKMLASTAFTITAGIAQLLDTVANQDPGDFEEEVSVFPGLPNAEPEPAEKSGPPVSVPSLDLAKKSVMPAVGVVLPPQLDTEIGRSLTDEPQPELPTFPDKPAVPQPTVPQPIVPEPTVPNPVETAAAQVVADTAKASPEEAVSAPVVPPVEQNQPPQPPVAPAKPASPPSPPPLSRPPMVSQPAQFVGTSILDDDVEADEIAAVLEDIDYDLRADTSPLDTLEPPGIEGALPTHQPTQTARHNHTEADNEASNQISDQTSDSNSRRQSNSRVAANVDFQALRLKDHFWERLSTLTHESHKEATQLAENMKSAGVSRGNNLPAAPAFPMDNDEVVIYDEPPQSASQSASQATYPQTYEAPTTRAPRPAMGQSVPKPPLPKVGDPPGRQRSLGNQSVNQSAPGSRSGFSSFTPPAFNRPTFNQSTINQSSANQSPASQSPASQSTQGLSSEDLPDMIMPVISVPIGDLVAGEMVTITVRTRPSTYKPFIKLWMIDRQSRSLVIEPQLLTNLMPDALGDLEGTAKLQVPRDCLDVQIAAIAIDMATQQESGKAVVNRHVVPAGQMSASRSGLNF